MTESSKPGNGRRIIRALSDSANAHLKSMLDPEGTEEIQNLPDADGHSIGAESTATAQLYSLAANISAASEKPRFVATVLAVAEKSKSTCFGFSGEQVRVLRSNAFPHLENQLGYAMPDLHHSNERFVVFTSGEHGNFTLTDAAAVPADGKEIVVTCPPQFRRTLVVQDGRHLDITIPETVTLLPGDVVNLTPEGNFIGVAAWNENTGDIAVVEEITNEHQCLVRIMGSALKSVIIAAPAKPVAVGHRVVLESTGRVALRNLGMVETGYHFAEKPTETWAQVVGQDDVVKAIRRALRAPKQGKANVLRRKPRKGGVLIGPPGCGKTHLARAAANECGMLFFYIKAPELFRSLVGEAEAIIRQIIKQGEANFAQTGQQYLVFIDEIDAIAKTRGTNLSSDAAETILLTLMTEMNDSHAFFLAATNRIDTIDPALLRPGRLTLKLYVGRPDQQAAEMLFKLYLTGVTIADHTVDELARLATAELYSTRYPLYNLNVTPVDGNPQEISFGLQDVASGALINEGIIEQAKEIAEDEADAANSPEALTLQHIKEAITLVYHGEQQVNHRQAIEEYAEQRYPDAGIGVTRLYQKQK